jgi:hypothetical protein
MGGNEYHDTKDATMTVVNADPTPQSLSYLDVNSTTTGKTGSSSIIVQSQSTLRIRTTPSTAKKSATIASYNLNINNNDYTPTISSGYVYVDFVSPSLSGTFLATMTTTDSRGNMAVVTTNVVVQPWEPPTALFTLSRVNGFYTNTILYVDASMSSVSNTNSMTIKEQHRKSGESTWSTAATVQNKTNTTIALDNSYAWEMQILVTDEYTTTTYNATVGKGIPIMFIDKDKNSIGVNGYPDANNQIYVAGTVKAKPNATDAGVVLPHTYSETEQVVGYWIDGRPIYEKTIISSTEVTVSANAWKSPAFTISDVNVTVISGLPSYWSATSSVFVVWNFMCIQSNTSDKKKVDLYNSRNASCQVNRLTIRYIKD